MSETPAFRPAALGEIAIRCADMAGMIAFYRDVLHLEVLNGGPTADITFFRIAPGVAGHTSVLALFRHDAANAARPGLHPSGHTPPETGARSSLHHLALSLPRHAQDLAITEFDNTGQPYRIEIFGWIGWRGVFLTDPEGNTVELVAHDPEFAD
ncbi:MAG: VOC family protein [Pseudomonadota bacterium]